VILNKATQANLSAAFFRQLFSGQKAVLQALSVLGVLAFLASPTMADDSIVGDATAGADKAGTCAACHGQDGNSVNPQWPSLAGQNASYLVATLQAFKDGTRSDVLMGAQAGALNEQDMADLAAHFAAQTPARRTADPVLAEAGTRLYRGGDIETEVSACIACHGPTGRGNAPAAYPALAGQHAAYTAKQLNDYKSGKRTSDGDSQIMRNITARLSQDEIAAVAAYMQGLY
jgi:cytochrome c553